MTDIKERETTHLIDTVAGNAEDIGDQASAALAAPGRLILIAPSDSDWRAALIDVIGADIEDAGRTITWVHNPGLPEAIAHAETGKDLIVTGCLPGVAVLLREKFGADTAGGKIVCDIRPQFAAQGPGAYRPPADYDPLADSPEN